MLTELRWKLHEKDPARWDLMVISPLFSFSLWSSVISCTVVCKWVAINLVLAV